ncbi:membrane lipoprotein lipid attachment site-containing protein [Algibacter lectus]|uniref:membrane lipoprotein lipid attachment site-containing protein n=1 Tax=Algibacter lectus TaxID=221126 RepID=UPI002494EB98|nr:membrane lipoprotein lipid attachment site-containing protein [Algibacter lectus]
MKKTFLVLIAVLALTACSSKEEEESNAVTTDSINQSEWAHKEDDRSYYIYFSVGDIMRISHPYYDYGSKSIKNFDIDGTFTYNKPNVTISFEGECSDSGFVFSSCDVSGTINGTVLTINDNGTTYQFDNQYPNE